MSPDTPAERKRRQRARDRGELPPLPPDPICPGCGKAAKGEHAPLCSRCWLKTPEGREWQRLRMQTWRKRDAM